MFNEHGLFSEVILPTSPTQKAIETQKQVLVSDGSYGYDDLLLSPVTYALTRWLSYHLDKHQLLEWIIESGRHLLIQFRSQVRRMLNESESNEGISEPLRQIWQVISSEAFSIGKHDYWQSYPKIRPDIDDKWSIIDIIEFLEHLRPVLILQKPLYLGPIIDEDEESGDIVRTPKRIQDIIRTDITTASNDIAYTIPRIISGDTTGSLGDLSALADVLTSNLLSALNWLECLDEASEKFDRSMYAVPSIAPHPQNRSARDWAILIHLCRESALDLFQENEQAGIALLARWRYCPYPVFQRLLLHIATEIGEDSLSIVIDQLTSNPSNTLWSYEAQRECLRFLRKQGRYLSAEQVENLCEAIISGPPRDLYRENLTEEEFTSISTKQVWHRLAKLRTAGSDLPEAALIILTASDEQFGPLLADSDRDEFSHWMESSFGPHSQYSVQNMRDMTPTELAELLISEVADDEDLANVFQLMARVAPLHAIHTVRVLSEMEHWNQEVWAHAFIGIRGRDEKGQCGRVWKTLSPTIPILPVTLLEEISRPLCMWLQAVTRGQKLSDVDGYIEIWDLLWKTKKEEIWEDQSILSAAINSPSGILIEVLLEKLGDEGLAHLEGIPDHFTERFENALEQRPPGGSYGIVVLASRLHFLHWLDRHQTPLTEPTLR